MGSDWVQQFGSGGHSSGPLSDSEFRLFKDLIYEECGISIGVEKRTFLESRLKRRMGEIGIKSGYEYYCLIKRPEGKSRELPALLDTLMICETSFFRNQPQFELFKDVVIPQLASPKERAGSRMIRVWSAGCSTGQEPYSIAMTLLESINQPELWSVRVFASDLSFTALERAQTGRYRQEQIKNIEPYYLSKYFQRENGHYSMGAAVKKHVIFDYHNLKHDNGLRGLDIVFCRNVMIYFDQEEQRRLVSRFANALLPGGYLFVGHAETLQGLSDRFTMIHRNKGIAYRLEG